MAANLNFTMRRNNGTDYDVLYPKTTWDQVLNKPSSYTPAWHEHTKQDITDWSVYRSIKNFTSVSFNGTTEISCPVTEDPRGKHIGIVFAYVYMGSRHSQIVWLRMENTTIDTTVVLAGGIASVSTTSISHMAFNVYLKSSNNTIFIKNAHTQIQNSSTSSADTITSIPSTYGYVYDIITLN
jgi:hypothetical protein